MRLKFSAIVAAVGFAAGYLLQKGVASSESAADARRRGRFADTPLGMTWSGWKDVLWRTWDEANNDRLLSVAAAVAFYTLLSVAPALSLLVSTYGLVIEPQEIYRQISIMTAQLPEAARQIIEDQAMRLTTQPVASLSWTLLISLAVAAWSANAAIKALFDGLNVIYDETEKRSFLVFNAVSLATTLGAVILVVSALFLIAVIPRLVAQGPFAATFDVVVVWLRWPVFLIGGSVAIAILYWLGPSRHPARWEWILPGALIAAFFWMAVSGLFSWYVSTLGNYAATYGSLTTVIVFMTWVWLSVAIILLGAEINAELEHQTAQDTTIGAPKPLGARGAVVADNIGPSRPWRGS